MSVIIDVIMEMTMMMMTVLRSSEAEEQVQVEWQGEGDTGEELCPRERNIGVYGFKAGAVPGM